MIIITGINGFVGSNLRSYLYDKEKKTLGASRNPSIDEVHYSEINKTLLNNTNCFIHLAGKAHDIKKSFIFNTFSWISLSTTRKRIKYLRYKKDLIIFSLSASYLYKSIYKVLSYKAGKYLTNVIVIT